MLHWGTGDTIGCAIVVVATVALFFFLGLLVAGC